MTLERVDLRLVRLCSDIRNFRTDAAVSADVLDELFSILETMIAKWLAER